MFIYASSNQNLDDFRYSVLFHKSQLQYLSSIFYYFREDGRQSKIIENFTLKPVNLSESIGSRLKASFAQVNRSTPVESLSGEPLIGDDYNSKKTAKERRKTALIAGTSVGLGALLLASLLVGGTLIATNGDSSKIPLSIIMWDAITEL